MRSTPGSRRASRAESRTRVRRYLDGLLAQIGMRMNMDSIEIRFFISPRYSGTSRKWMSACSKFAGLNDPSKEL
jgi:hypothetical protein